MKLHVDEVAGKVDLIEYMTPDEVEREYARQERALPAPSKDASTEKRASRPRAARRVIWPEG